MWRAIFITSVCLTTIGYKNKFSRYIGIDEVDVSEHANIYKTTYGVGNKRITYKKLNISRNLIFDVILNCI